MLGWDSNESYGRCLCETISLRDRNPPCTLFLLLLQLSASLVTAIQSLLIRTCRDRSRRSLLACLYITTHVTQSCPPRQHRMPRLPTLQRFFFCLKPAPTYAHKRLRACNEPPLSLEHRKDVALNRLHKPSAKRPMAPLPSPSNLPIMIHKRSFLLRRWRVCSINLPLLHRQQGLECSAQPLRRRLTTSPALHI